MEPTPPPVHPNDEKEKPEKKRESEPPKKSPEFWVDPFGG